MKLIKFLDQQIQQWCKTQKCGQCYEFYAPLTEEALNKQQIKDCCINVMLTRDRGQAFGVDRIYNNTLDSISDKFEYKNFNLYFIVPQGININNHSEVLNHSTELSKSILLEDLEKCIIELEFDFCKHIGNKWQLTQWSAQQLINFRDNNYTGFRLSVTIRKRVDYNYSR